MIAHCKPCHIIDTLSRRDPVKKKLWTNEYYKEKRKCPEWTAYIKKYRRDWLKKTDRRKKEIDELKTNYIKSQIWKSSGLKFDEITEEMVELKRASMLIYREISEIKRLLNGTA